MKRFYKGWLAAASIAVVGLGLTAIADNIYVFDKDAKQLFSGEADKVALSEDKATVTAYQDGKAVFSSEVSKVGSIEFQAKAEKPVADLFDVQFNEDGAATDVSQRHMTVEKMGTSSKTYFNKVYDRYAATFVNEWGTGSGTTGYYKIDYEQNDDFKAALADGHTLEAVVMASEGVISNGEAKFLASHESGGTGLMVCKTGNGMNKTNELTFLPNVTTANKSMWRWCTTGVVPEAQRFYHIVGVWNKEEAKAYVYVDGQLMNVIDAPGDFWPIKKSGSQWFAIGCDAGPTGQFGWTGDVVIARGYDKPLSSAEVTTLWDEVSALSTEPKADMLDLQFNEDGTATDVSAMKNAVESHPGEQGTYYNNTYKRYVAKFNNPWAGSPVTGYYKVDYSNNQEFKDKLADGHTLEAVVMAGYTEDFYNDLVANPNEKEAKFFASHEAGGTGLYLCKGSKGLNKKNEITFLPNVTETGKSTWRFATSGIVPEPQKYYHVVGVWNKDEGKAYIYVDGKLMNTVDAVGNFKFPSAKGNWFAIGCDAGPSAQLGWIGDVVTARIYDKPLNEHEVFMLWNEIDKLQQEAQPILVTDVTYTSGLPLKAGMQFAINGKGFQEGDQLKVTSTSNEQITATLPVALTETGIAITIPEGVPSGEYRMVLYRGQNFQDLGTAQIEIVTSFPVGAEVIAHRGYHAAGAPENSRAAVKAAQELGVYGAEIDIWITKDGKLVVNHNASISGIEIQNSTFEQLSGVRLSNGETIPTLEELLDLIKNSDSATKLIIEVKEHASETRTQDAAKAAVDAVIKAGVQDKVEYISFVMAACSAITTKDASAKAAYLKGGFTPAQVKALGSTGLDYHIAEFNDHPEWIQQAKDLGLTVNVWTINSVADISRMTTLGVQYVTTDDPVTALMVKKHFDDNQGK